jgi:Immunoglobulin-like domain of bacterial spore germination/Sporulation and spore germination
MNRSDMGLREAFEARAAQVEVSPDALGSIREKISRRSRHRRGITIGLASLATAAAAGLVAILVTVGTSTPPVTAPTPPVGGPSVSVEPSPSAAPASITVTVPVYFAATVDGRAVLYREFRSVTVAEDSLVERTVRALGLSLAGDALDPDYGTRWASGRIAHVAEQGTEVAVEITGAPPGIADDTIAVQQIVWTVTAVAADMGAPGRSVRITVDGVLIGGGPLQRASTLDTLAHVWLVSPQQGETVAASFTVTIVGTVWEATARLRVRDHAGTPVYDEMVMLDIGAPAQGKVEVPLTLAPGDYTIEAYYVSAVENVGELSVDGHEITVR